MFAGGIGMQEILIILVVGLLVFGAARLPKIARSLGLGIKEFKKTVKGLEEDVDSDSDKVRYVQNQPPNYPNQQGQPYAQYNAGQQNPNTGQNYTPPNYGGGAPQSQPYGPGSQGQAPNQNAQNQNPNQGNASPQGDDRSA